MSSPMDEMPEHYPINVDRHGNGPAFGADIARMICWCGDDDCKRHLDVME